MKKHTAKSIKQILRKKYPDELICAAVVSIVDGVLNHPDQFPDSTMIGHHISFSVLRKMNGFYTNIGLMAFIISITVGRLHHLCMVPYVRGGSLAPHIMHNMEMFSYSIAKRCAPAIMEFCKRKFALEGDPSTVQIEAYVSYLSEVVMNTIPENKIPH